VFDPAAVAAEVSPTIFYREVEGGLKERVDVFLSHNHPVRRVAVELSVAGRTVSQKFETGNDFGEEHVVLSVPEFSGPARAEVTVDLDGRESKFKKDITPAKKWTLFVVPNEHLDIGYTDFPAKVAEVHSRVIDEAMELIGDHPEFRFTLDGFWEAEQFENGRTAEEKEKFYEMVRGRRIAVPPQYASLFTQYASSEALLRSLYDGAAFNRLRGGYTDYVSITDIPSFSWSYASLMASCGFKYFIAGSNNDASPSLLFGKHHEHSPFVWEGPDGGRIVMWHARMYSQVASLFGMPPNLDLATQSLPVFLQIYDRADYPSDATIIYGTQPENTDLFPQQAALAKAWAAQYAFPRLQYSSFPEALDHITGGPTKELPVVRGDGGSFWESFNTQAAKYAALGRQNEARALSAEKIATVSAIANPRVAPATGELKELWKDIVLMDEHTWDSSRSVSHPLSRQTVEQQSEKEELAVGARRHINRIVQRSLAGIADRVTAPPQSVLVFNALNWKRDGLVDFDLDEGWEILDGVTAEPVSYEIRSTKLTRRVRFLATDVPGMGYKVYRLRRTTAKSAPKTSASGQQMENSFYRVTLDPATGSIRSIYDKELRRELVNADSDFRFGQYVYVTGGDELPNRLVAYQTSSPFPKLQAHGSANGRVVSVERSPFGIVARLESSAPNTPRVQAEILLLDKQKKIEINYEGRNLFRLSSGGENPTLPL
jgi:alpha-mannosidase